jgi:RNA recognition motif-containing protein
MFYSPLLPTPSTPYRNIPFHMTPEDIKFEFERHGRVKDVYIPKDYATRCPALFVLLSPTDTNIFRTPAPTSTLRKSRGFAFVEFHDRRDGEVLLMPALEKGISLF